MASLDSLPADQRAVLSLVLERGRSFDQIANLLSIDRAAVRQRALDGLDALGPETQVDPLKRGLIVDFLLGQLPAGVVSTVTRSLATQPPERAWARVVAAEIAPLAVNPIPEIPAPGSVGHGEAPDGGAFGEASELEDPDRSVIARASEAEPPGEEMSAVAGASAATAARARPGAPASSRRGGAILLGLTALVVAAVAVVLLFTGGSSKQPSAFTPVTPATGAAASLSSSTGTSTGTSTATRVTPLHQINLISPTTVPGREGAADVVRAGGKLGIVLVAQGLAANAGNAYGVWLLNSATRASHFLGFYGQKVASTGTIRGELEAEDALPPNATQYNQLLLTLETSEHPATPGTIVLEGPFAE